MMNVHQPIKDIMNYYAKKLENQSVSSILNKGSIDSENEAIDLLIFLNPMSESIAIDAKKNIVVLRQPIHTTDAVKICDVIEDYIEEMGYEHLIE